MTWFHGWRVESAHGFRRGDDASYDTLGLRFRVLDLFMTNCGITAIVKNLETGREHEWPANHLEKQ